MERTKPEIIITEEEYKNMRETVKFWDRSTVDSLDGVFECQSTGKVYRVPNYHRIDMEELWERGGGRCRQPKDICDSMRSERFRLMMESTKFDWWLRVRWFALGAAVLFGGLLVIGLIFG